ncbi:12307_t:CDS:1, partial [Ambispora gerdemannii]
EIVHGYPIQVESSNAPDGFLTVIVKESEMKNYLNPYRTGSVISAVDAPCTKYQPVTPVSTCSYNGDVTPPDVYCLAVTNPQL